MLLEKTLETENKKKETEIDLLGLLNSFTSSIAKNKYNIIITSLAGIGVGLALYFTAKPVYTSQMTGYSETLKEEVVEGIIMDLQRTLEDKDYVLAQKFLGLSKSKVEAIKQITCRPAIEKSIYEKDESGIFVIEASVSNVDVLDSLAIALEYYFQQNYFVKKKISLEKYRITQLIKNIDTETASLLKLQTSMNEAIDKNTYRTNLFLSDIGYASAKIVELLDKRADLENKLQLMEEIKILKNFVKFNKKTSPKMYKSLLLGEVICFILFLVILTIRAAYPRMTPRKAHNRF